MFVRCWHMSLSSLSCHFTRYWSHLTITLRLLIFTVINPVNCKRGLISLFHLFSQSDDHWCGPRWGLLTTECIVRDGVYTCTQGVQAVCTPVQSTWNVTYSLHREQRMSHGNKDSHNSTCGEKYLPSWHSWARMCSLLSQTGSHIGNGTQRVAHWSLTCHEDIIGACQEMVRVSQPLIVSPSPRVTSAQ